MNIHHKNTKKDKTQSRHACRRLLLPAAICAVLSGPSTVLAQGFALEEVVVSARKQDESLQDIPIAVTSFSDADMKMLNITQTADVASFSPSVFIEQPGGNSGTVAKVTIRGQSQSDNIITLDPSVGWYLDDIYLARTQGTNVSMFDIDRVEVLKGPQGTLYGRNTTGGTMKLVTTKAEPSAGITGHVVGGVGNYEQSKIGGGINIPIVQNVLAIRLTALQDKVDDGYQDVTLYDGNPISPTTGQVIDRRTNGTKDNELYRLGLTFEPSDDWRVLLSYEQNESDISMANTNISRDPGPVITTIMPGGFGIPYIEPSSDFMDVALNNPNTAYSKSKTASATVEYIITDDLSTKLVYGWRDVYTEFDTDIDGTNQAFNLFAFPFEQVAEQHSIEWQLNGTAMDGGLDWVTGIYWFQEKGEDNSYSGGLSTFAANVHYNLSRTIVDDNTSRSAFFQGTLHLTDSLNFTGGLRYTKDEKPVKAIAAGVGFDGSVTCRFAPNANVPKQNNDECSWSNSDSYEFISWTVGFDYAFDYNTMAYIKAASASRSGGQNTRGLDAVTTLPFDPEKATDIEIGFKGQLFDNTLQLNVAYYHTFYEDIQQSNLINTPSGLITTVVNQAEADIDGLEVEAKWLVTESLQFSASMGLMNWAFNDDRSILPSAPTEEYAVRANYMIPTGYGRWLFDVNWTYRGEYFGNCAAGRDCIREFEPETGDSVDMWGARIGVDIDPLGLNVALWGRNLTDEKYVTPALQLYFPPTVTLSNGIIGAPRTYGVEVTYNF